MLESASHLVQKRRIDTSSLDREQVKEEAFAECADQRSVRFAVRLPGTSSRAALRLAAHAVLRLHSTLAFNLIETKGTLAPGLLRVPDWIGVLAGAPRGLRAGGWGPEGECGDSRELQMRGRRADSKGPLWAALWPNSISLQQPA
ncbi:hypothetical protein AAFF_G00363540 [Aldrovandia affinis]|uniref:Uncharacterized protein n=1 Tax=Aldrovandia affinis TaxID=143900 RepID=A0AAD7SIB5_9TELE|nr:hypothetical protein AAFF_G00363540 [Aldrovandia affinis]